MTASTLWFTSFDGPGKPWSGKRYECTWEQFGEKLQSPFEPSALSKDELPGFSLGTFQDNYRCKANVELIYILGLDVDAGVTLDQAERCFAGFDAYLFSTFSHRPDAHRFRVAVRLSRPVTGPEYDRLHEFVRRKSEAQGFRLAGAEQAKDCSRFWFLPTQTPHYEVRTLRGAPLDVDATLAVAPPVPERTTNVVDDAALAGPINGMPLAERTQRARAYVAKMPPAIEHQGGHDATFAVAATAARGFALSRAAVLDVLCEYNERCQPPWSGKELLHKADEGARRGGGELGHMVQGTAALPNFFATVANLAANQPAAQPAAPAVDLLPTVGVDQLFAELPKVPYIVQELDIAPGRPSLYVGYGWSGKSIAAMDLALEVAAHAPDALVPRSLWGRFAILRGGNVLHLNFEMSSRLVAERYQRLARAKAIDPARLAGKLHVANLPPGKLDDPRLEQVLLKKCEGKVLSVVDSLRRSAPNTDENSSEICKILDMLTRISEATGSVFVVIHHSRKPTMNGGGAKYEGRGSSAIFDGAGSWLSFSANEKGAPIKVTHERTENHGVPAEDFLLVIEDVEIDGDARAGLRIRVDEPPKGTPAGFDVAESERRARLVAVLDTDAHITTQGALYSLTKMNRNKAAEAYGVLAATGVVEKAHGAIVLSDSARANLDRAREQIREDLRRARIANESGVFTAALPSTLTIADLRLRLAREGLDIYLEAAVTRLIQAGQVRQDGDSLEVAP